MAVTDKLYACSDCHREKPASDYYPSASNARRGWHDGLNYTCKDCAKAKARRWHHDNGDEARARLRTRNRKTWTQRAYGVPQEYIDALLVGQGHKCALCQSDLTRYHIDHDHQSGKVRGILCKGCNTGLGLLGDNIEGLQRALTYLLGGKDEPTTDVDA